MVDIKVMDRNIRVSGIKSQILRMDRFILSNVAFGICDIMETFSNQTLPNVPTMWIGNSAMEAMSITVDPRKSEIALRPANSQPPPKSIRVPFVMRDHRLYLEITVNAKQKFEALLDTGSVGTLIPADVAKKLKLTPISTAQVEEKNGKKVNMGIARLEEVALGKLHVKDIQALYITEPVKDGPDPDMAIIGNDLLLRYRFTIDYGRLEIYFEELPPMPVVKPMAQPTKPPEKKSDKKTPKDGKEPKDTKTGAGISPTVSPNVKIDGKNVVVPTGPVYGPPLDKMIPPDKQIPIPDKQVPPPDVIPPT